MLPEAGERLSSIERVAGSGFTAEEKATALQRAGERFNQQASYPGELGAISSGRALLSFAEHLAARPERSKHQSSATFPLVSPDENDETQG